MTYGDIFLESFLPKPFWQKRGLILLLNHPKVKFTQLPDVTPRECEETVIKQELLVRLNPVAICNGLEKENKEWLQFFAEYHFDKKVPLGFNPIKDEEFLGKLILNKLAVLNHRNTYDLQARYILPIKTLLSNLLKFPDKRDKVKVVLDQTQSSFFESYQVFELLCYFEQYNSITKEKNGLESKNKEDDKYQSFYKTLISLKEFTLNGFDRNGITVNLKNLTKLQNQYLALKNE